ncbi:hypothetical protein MON38_06250 [Hymenobacter sp. DH14]|uniref:Uncharacterized protein n=1 Tax=Hymenobacter cyanobacteriorum TaxID=2926463 RepID=A0A9X2AFX7_9BACT|nr:hypothetical protein [Hymenobacter cyanobacteriorum]MCI1187013.1 hypothetical protein [Hymenobacter cyanobacteriorum]
MPILARTDFKLGTKILMYGSTVGFGLLAVWNSIDCLRTKDFGHLWIIAIPVFISCVAGFIYTTRHELTLSDMELVQYGFRRKHIPLEQIVSIVENLGAYEVKSPNTSIRITTDLQNKNLFKDQLIAQIQEIDTNKNSLPGRRLANENQHKIFEQIQHMINVGMETETLFEADSSLFEQLTESAYYLVYEHPVHSFLNRAYDAEGEEVSSFLKRLTETPTTSGPNIFVLPHHLEWLILCLGNGDILVKPVEE